LSLTNIHRCSAFHHCREACVALMNVLLRWLGVALFLISITTARTSPHMSLVRRAPNIVPDWPAATSAVCRTAAAEDATVPDPGPDWRHCDALSALLQQDPEALVWKQVFGTQVRSTCRDCPRLTTRSVCHRQLPLL
jgi:hypothetical protein